MDRSIAFTLTVSQRGVKATYIHYDIYDGATDLRFNVSNSINNIHINVYITYFCLNFELKKKDKLYTLNNIKLQSANESFSGDAC